MKKIVLLVLITLVVVVGCQVESVDEKIRVRAFSPLTIDDFTLEVDDNSNAESFIDENVSFDDKTFATFIFNYQYPGFRRTINELTEIVLNNSFGARSSGFSLYVTAEDETIEDVSVTSTAISMFSHDASKLDYEVEHFDYAITSESDDDVLATNAFSANYKVSYTDSASKEVEGIHSVYYYNEVEDNQEDDESSTFYRYKETFGHTQHGGDGSESFVAYILTELDVKQTKKLVYEDNDDVKDALDLIDAITGGYTLGSYNWDFNEELTKERFNTVIKPLLWKSAETPLSLTITISDGEDYSKSYTYTDWEVIEIIRPEPNDE